MISSTSLSTWLPSLPQAGSFNQVRGPHEYHEGHDHAEDHEGHGHDHGDHDHEDHEGHDHERHEHDHDHDHDHEGHNYAHGHDGHNHTGHYHQIGQDFCIPAFVENTTCPNSCPVQCHDDEQACSGGLDPNGCAYDDFCIPVRCFQRVVCCRDMIH